MKKLSVLVGLILLTTIAGVWFTVNAQINSNENLPRIILAQSLMNNEIMKNGSVKNTQTTSDGSMPQFLFPQFSMSNVIMKDGNIQNIIMNYNIVSEKMVFQKDNDLFDLTNVGTIDTVILQQRKFVSHDGAFFEVLLKSPVALFIQYKGTIVPPGKPAAYGGTSQVSNSKYATSVHLSSGYYNLKLPADYTVNTSTTYWVNREGDMKSFTNARQFMKLFNDDADEIKQFIKKNKIKFSDNSDVCKLVEYWGAIKK